jgi:hypothetical protein
MITYKGTHELAEEARRNNVIPERTRTLIGMGIPVVAATMLASKPGVGYEGLPSLDKLAEDYKLASESGLPEMVAATVAVSEGKFRSEKDGLDKVVSSYQKSVEGGFSEQEAIRRAIF